MDDDDYRRRLAMIEPISGMWAARAALAPDGAEQYRREMQFISDPIIFHLARPGTALSVADISSLVVVRTLAEPAAYVVTAPRNLHDGIREAVRLYLPMGIRVDVVAPDTALAPLPHP